MLGALLLLACDGGGENSGQPGLQPTSSGVGALDGAVVTPGSDAGLAQDASSVSNPGSTVHPTPQTDAQVQVAPQGGGAVTYYRNIRAVMERSCLDCHTKGGIGPIPFDDWPSVQSVAGQIAGAVASGIMPPSGWNQGCQKLAEDRSLTAEQLALFAQWQAAGFPEGNPADYVAPPPRAKKELGEPSIVMSMGVQYTPPANGDEYRCFLLDAIPDDVYLTGMQIIPGQADEVHHVIIHRVDAADLVLAQLQDDGDSKPGYVCSGGPGVNAQNMFSYRPGSEAVTFDKGDAAYMPGGSSLIIQVHYNTVFLPQGTVPTPDETKIAMWTLPAGQLPDRVVYRTTTFGPINIPANANHVGSNISQGMSSLASLGGALGFGGTFIPGEIIGMTPHAHQLATVMNASLKRADGGSTCLDDVKWDFQWQLDYIFAAGVPYAEGDTFVASCTYDNSAENQPIINGTRQVSRAVSFGERSTDEMCEHYIWLRFPRDAFLAAR
jgi:hypothetical protein